MSWPKKVVFPTESTNVTYRHWYVPSIVCISHNFQINWSGLFGNFTLTIVCTLNDSIEECVLAEPSFGFALRRQPSSSCAFLKWTQANLELCKGQTVDFLKVAARVTQTNRWQPGAIFFLHFAHMYQFFLAVPGCTRLYLALPWSVMTLPLTATDCHWLA